MTPGEYRGGGLGLVIDYGFHATPFGWALVGLTPRGVCASISSRPPSPAAAGLRAQVAAGRLQKRSGSPPKPSWMAVRQPCGRRRCAAGAPCRRYKLPGQRLEGVAPHSPGTSPATAKWPGHRPAGATGRSERRWGQSGGGAHPRHRVIRETGELGGYRWGIARKSALHCWEVARGG